MGEANRRKQIDPNYGRAPKSSNFGSSVVRPPNKLKDSSYRGLVVSPPIQIEGTRLFAKSSNLDPQELRFALLFWDQLVWPSSRAIHFGSGPDEEFLERAGVLTRPEYTFYGDVAQGIARTQIQAYQDLERTEPGMWALAQGENSLLLKEGFADEGSGALVELHRAIQVPKHDVPLAEILEFRQRRRDELVLLRHQLESFVFEIQGSEDKSLALEKRVAELDQACSNLLALGKEWRFPVYLSNIRASFSISPMKFLPLVGVGWKIGEPYGLTAATAVAAITGAVSTLEIKGDYGLRSMKLPTSPYRYAYHMHEELR